MPTRRDFLAASAMLGYSVYIDATHAAPRDPTALTRAQRQQVFERISPPPDAPQPASPEPHMTLVDLDCDVMVAGGGMAGVCAAVSAARHGARVLLVQDRSRLGGNASSEIRMHIVGADHHGGRPGWREGGLIEEFRLEDAVYNPHRAWELWDLMLYDKVISEPNLTLLLDTSVYAAHTVDSRIQHVMARCDKTEHLYRVKADIFCDCTGDSRLALEAGAEMRQGREAIDDFGETLAQQTADRRTQGSSILFTSRKHDHPIAYKAPAWARKITRADLKFRGISSWEYGYWWIELGGMYDTIRDNEQLRFELLSVVLGVWDYIKNSGDHPDSANWALQTVGMIPGKRESRRIVGDHINTQQDIQGDWKTFKDAVAIGGWPLDDHPPEGFDAPEVRPYRSIPVKEPYNIPLGALYSKNLTNLMMAGRNISNTHVAFTSTRVMATCSVIGQAVGTAAAFCTRDHISPRRLRNDKSRLQHYQQTLLRDDQAIRNLKNEDPDDLALKAAVTASATHEDAEAAHAINGFVRDMPGQWTNRWAAPLEDHGAWIELSWERPQTLSHIQLTFDTGFHRQLTLTASDWANRNIHRGPQPETVKAYRITVTQPDGRKVEVAGDTNNYQRLRRHNFDPVQARTLRIQITETHGNELARLYEVRCYTKPPRSR